MSANIDLYIVTLYGDTCECLNLDIRRVANESCLHCVPCYVANMSKAIGVCNKYNSQTLQLTIPSQPSNSSTVVPVLGLLDDGTSVTLGGTVPRNSRSRRIFPFPEIG